MRGYVVKALRSYHCTAVAILLLCAVVITESFL